MRLVKGFRAFTVVALQKWKEWKSKTNVELMEGGEMDEKDVDMGKGVNDLAVTPTHLVARYRTIWKVTPRAYILRRCSGTSALGWEGE